MLVFSGRPDPEWTVTVDQVRRLDEIWAALGPAPPRSPSAPKLGYRGVELHLDDGSSYLASAGQVTKTLSGASETRVDPDRRFERVLIATAPPGSLPPGTHGPDWP
jgi:hypothetical protein